MGHTTGRVLPLSTAIANTSQPVLSIHGPGTRSPQPEQSEHPTSTVMIVPSRMNAAVTLDATTSSSSGHKSCDRCQNERSSACTSGLAWWEVIPVPPALLRLVLWL